MPEGGGKCLEETIDIPDCRYASSTGTDNKYQCSRCNKGYALQIKQNEDKSREYSCVKSTVENCLVLSLSDSSNCQECEGGFGVASDGTCKLPSEFYFWLAFEGHKDEKKVPADPKKIVVDENPAENEVEGKESVPIHELVHEIPEEKEPVKRGQNSVLSSETIPTVTQDEQETIEKIEINHPQDIKKEVPVDITEKITEVISENPLKPETSQNSDTPRAEEEQKNVFIDHKWEILLAILVLLCLVGIAWVIIRKRTEADPTLAQQIGINHA
jgi:hypothetical protein